ncbi:MAG: class I SAM-dependent methyltransferase [Microlunatus sp.]
MTSHHSDAFRRLGAAFAAGGGRYDRLRPGYPEQAVSWLLEGMPNDGVVVDIGAGTGKLTLAMAARGYDVIAVDPSADMLDQLSRRSPTTMTKVGTGEATGLPDDVADLVTFAQSWHWVDPVAGVTEILRILKPGGSAGWIWNFMDVREPWVAQLAEIWHTVAGDDAIRATRNRPGVGPPFGALESITIDWSLPMSMGDLAELATTRSYYLNASETEQLQIRNEVAAYLLSQFGEAVTVDLPYRTHCFRAALHA